MLLMLIFFSCIVLFSDGYVLPNFAYGFHMLNFAYCFHYEMNKTIIPLITGSSNQTCNASSWVQCAAQLGKCEVVCEAGFTDVACMSCLGRTADECIYCLPQVAKPGLIGSDQQGIAM